MSVRNKPREAAVFGVDIGKNVFHVVGLDPAGHPIQKATFRRDTVLQFFEGATPTIVGIEACPGSPWLARKLQGFGHTVRIVAAKFVEPFVKSNKSDIIDAEAIAGAVTRPTMRFVEVRTSDQIDVQALHRVRGTRPPPGSAHQGYMPDARLLPRILHCDASGAGKFKADMPRVLEDEDNDLSAPMRQLLMSLFEDIRYLEQRIAEVSRQIEAAANADDTARRLMTVPGIGALTATGLLAAAGTGRQFKRTRDMAAWLGLVPRGHSTGGKTTLLGISKRGRYIGNRVHGLCNIISQRSVSY